MLQKELINHTGFHSDIYKGTFRNGRDYLTKSYGRKAEGFDMSHAQEIVAHMRRFDTVARKIGVPTVNPYGFLIEKNGHPGKVNLIEAVPTAGVDLRVHFANPQVSNRDVLADITTYLQLFKRVWSNGHPISLDPPPANFCKGPDNKLRYIDKMPPRQQLSEGEYITEWPMPPEESSGFIKDRYFSTQQAQVIYPQLLRAINGRAIPHETIKFTIGATLGIEAFKQIDMHSTKKERILTSPQPTDVDMLRIMAAEQHSDKAISDETFKEIYHLTHIHIGGILPQQEDVQKASKLLGR